MANETNTKEEASSIKSESQAEGQCSGGSMTSPQEMQTAQLSAHLQQMDLGASTGGETTVKATSTPLSQSDCLKTDEFLARVNINDKICNILRDPPPPNSGVRQRSVFTANNPTSSRFNAAATPFVSHQRPMSASSAGPSMASPMAAGGGGMGGMGTSMKDAVLTGSGHMRHLPMNIRHIPPSPHHRHFGPGGYETPITSRSGGVTRPMYNHTRYGIQAQSPQVYYEGADISRMFPTPLPPPPFAVNRLNSHRGYEYDCITPPPSNGIGPIVMANGTIQLRMRDGIRIDITLDQSIRVLNQRSNVAVALSRNGQNSSMVHPNGRILQTGSKVEIVTYDGMRTNSYVRYAKMWYKGVSFTSESCALIYLVDTAGTRTTTDTFTDLSKDYSLSVFYDEARHGGNFYNNACEMLAESKSASSDDGTDMYDINGYRITQAADGLVKVVRGTNKYLIRTSPGNGSATLTTPNLHCTASLGKTSHLFVRRNEKRMHFDGSSFIVRNAGHSAGFNENNLLIVY